MRRFNDCKGQELVEFALILPIMVVILVAIAEMGFMWTLRGTVSDAVKSSVQQMQVIAGTTEANASATLRNNIETYLTNHGVPNASNVQVILKTNGENTTVNVLYTYSPTFTLPNFFGINLLPDNVRMSSTQVVNSAVFGLNTYTGETSLPTLPPNPTSILQSDPTGKERGKMAFLIDLPGDVDKIVNWWGHDIMTGNTGINASTGTIMVRSADQNGAWSDIGTGNNWRDTGDSYADLLLVNGYTTVVYADGSAGNNIDSGDLPGAINTYDGEIGNISWCKPSSSTAAGAVNCDGDITTSAASSSLLANSIYGIGDGYEVLTPVPAVTPADQVSLPSSAYVRDETYRNLTYDSDITKIKFYVPRAIAEASTFVAPKDDGNDLTNAGTRDLLLTQTFDTDGDGVPDYYDEHKTEADADKNGKIDGYQTAAFGAVAANYPEYEADLGKTDGKTGAIPTEKVTAPDDAKNLVPYNSTLDLASNANSFFTPADDGGAGSNNNFAGKECAVNGVVGTTPQCGEDRPYFLRIKNVYTGSTGLEMRVPVSAPNADIRNVAEKYRAPDPNKRIFVVEVLSRDDDGDSFFEKSGFTVVLPVDDDGNGDGKNDASAQDTAVYGSGGNYTKGLLFVNGTTGGSNFGLTADSTYGYSALDPTDTSAAGLDYTLGTKYTP